MSDKKTETKAETKAEKKADHPVAKLVGTTRYLGKVVKSEPDTAEGKLAVTAGDYRYPVAQLESDDPEEILTWLAKHPSGATFAVLDRKRPVNRGTWHTSNKFNVADFREFMLDFKDEAK